MHDGLVMQGSADRNPLGDPHVTPPMSTVAPGDETNTLMVSDLPRPIPRRCTRNRACLALAIATGLVVLAVWLWKATSPDPLPPPCTSSCVGFDHSLWDGVLQTHVVPGSSAAGITYSGLRYEGVRTDARFRAYLALLESVDLARLTTPARKALMINAYNALAVRLLLDECDPLCASIKDIGSLLSPVWKLPAGQIGGSTDDSLFSLDDIEHGYLRPTFSFDPRLHSAVNCASISCPDLAAAAFADATVEEQLTNRSVAWLSNPTKGLALSGGILTLSKIFDWYSGDFAAGGGAVGFARAHGPPSVVSALDGPALAYFDYNWGINNVS
jgi:hypothetical protein